VFTEPRGKGATLRSLKGLLGEDIAVDDQTTSTSDAVVAAAPLPRNGVVTRAAGPRRRKAPARRRSA
jgi:hypothetical protein